MKIKTKQTKEKKCPSCNWKNTKFFQLDGWAKDDWMCADCFLKELMESEAEYNIIPEKKLVEMLKERSKLFVQGVNHGLSEKERELKQDKRLEKLKVFYADEISDDVLKRLEGLEDLSNTDELSCKTHLFALDTIERILNNEDDDTNETTKNRIADLINKINERWLMIIWR